MTHENREGWLHAGINALRPHFGQAGYTVPDNVRVTCGWPSTGALAKKNRRIGECWSDTASDGKVFEIFITPALADPVRVLDILTHELVHATVGLAAKHGKLFKRCALAVGLEGKMRATVAGEALSKTLGGIARGLDAYPHQELKHMTTGQAKQGTRLIKAECGCCGYTVRVTRKWVDRDGAPLCPRESCDHYREPLAIG